MSAADRLTDERATLTAALLSSDAHLAERLRDARLTINPCEHWIGQEIAVCSPCLRDRIVPHIVDVVLAASSTPEDRSDDPRCPPSGPYLPGRDPVSEHDDDCQSMCWLEEWAIDALCSLPEGHEGPHIDRDQGYEW